METLQNTRYTLTKPLLETPSKWSIIHSVLACMKDGNKTTPSDVIKQVKQEILENKEFYTRFLSSECFDELTKDFDRFCEKNVKVIAEALTNIFKINIMILRRNEKQFYYLKDDKDYISPKRVKQSKERIMITVIDGHFYPFLHWKGKLYPGLNYSIISIRTNLSDL